MHVVIINGSPRVQKYSNTEKIIASFAKGLSEKGVSFETYAVSDRKSWENIQKAYIENEEILIALPLYVECIPGLLLEFLETLPKKDEHTRLSFLLQSGFSEGCQLRCGEGFLKELPGYLGVRYGGCLVKGDNFGIRFLNQEKQERITKPYQAMGELFARGGGMVSLVRKQRNLPVRNIFHCRCVCFYSSYSKPCRESCFRKWQHHGDVRYRLRKRSGRQIRIWKEF